MNKELFDCLLEIQETLKVEKTHNNDFGGYKYRSLPDIVQQAKPIANKHKCVIISKDKLVHEGDRYYVLAEAILMHESGETISATSLARETQNRPKMDEAQLTGGASSYARKYAYNGLFAIDDSKDTDALNNSLAYTQQGIPTKTMDQHNVETAIIAEGTKDVNNCKSIEELANVYKSEKYETIKTNKVWIGIINKAKERFNE